MHTHMQPVMMTRHCLILSGHKPKTLRSICDVKAAGQQVEGSRSVLLMGSSCVHLDPRTQGPSSVDKTLVLSGFTLNSVIHQIVLTWLRISYIWQKHRKMHAVFGKFICNVVQILSHSEANVMCDLGLHKLNWFDLASYPWDGVTYFLKMITSCSCLESHMSKNLSVFFP